MSSNGDKGAPKVGAGEVQCPDCGLTQRSLYQDGLLGCPVCYETFAVEVERALEEIHGSVQHIGKE